MAESTNRLSERIRAAIRASVRGLPARAPYTIACSGGADSICLAHAAARVAHEAGRMLVIAHIRHGMRPDDDADCARVAAFASSLGFPFVSESLARAGERRVARNIEARLRAGRYEALARLATGVGATAVLTGHTLDDQAETLLLHLLRGSGLDGLGGMQASGPLPLADAPASLRLLRPLLAIRRADTRAYCVAHTLPFADDPTNADTDFTRNWLRHAVLPLLETRFPAVAPTLARTAALLRDDAAVLDRQVHEALAACRVPSEPSLIVLDAARFASVAAPVRRRVLREILRGFGETVRADRLRDLDAAIDGARTATRRIGALRCTVAGGAILIGAEDVVQRYLHRDGADAVCCPPPSDGA